MSVVIQIKGLGNVPSFKNKKMIARKKLITRPEIQEWMSRCVHAFASQLSSEFQTRDSGTSPECLKQFAIASVPLDDNWRELEIGRASCRLVKSGEEGAVVTIEAL